MKRFSKILAVLLSVCVVAGLIAVFASADDTGYTDYTNDLTSSMGLSSYLSGVRNGLTTNADGQMESGTGPLSNTANTIVGVGEGENTYFRIFSTSHNNGTPVTATGRGGWVMVPSGEAQNVSEHDFVVLEYLFMAENLKYINGTLSIKSDFATATNYAALTIASGGDKTYVKGTNGSVFLSTVEGDWNTFALVIDSANLKAYAYVNGSLVNTKTLTADKLGKVETWELEIPAATVQREAGRNICVDNISYRAYGDGTGAYASEGFGVEELATAPTTSIYKCQDVAYNYNATQDAFPKSNVYDAEGVASVHTQSVVAEVDGRTYMFVGAGVEALATVENKVLKVYADAIMPANAPDSFVVEAYNDANVNFDALISHEVKKTVGNGVAVYRAVKQNYKTYIDNFDIIGTATSDAWEKVQLTAGGNNYLQLKALAASGALDYDTVAGTPTIRNARHTVIQFLLGAESGTYAEGTFISPQRTTSSDYNTAIGGIMIEKSGAEFQAKYYKNTAKEESNSNYATLHTNGDWNVVTIVIDQYASHTVGSAGMGVRASYYVNGVYLGGRSQSGTTSAHGGIAHLLFTATAAPATGANLLVDGYVARQYLNDGVATGETATYTTPDKVGLDEFFTGTNGAMATNEQFATLQDLYYSKYSTTEAYPKILVGGEIHTQQTDVVAEVNGVGYFDMATALAALEYEESTIKLFEGTNIEGIDLERFYVEVENKDDVTFVGYKTEYVEIDGGVRYTVTKSEAAYIGETPYDSVAEAFEDLQKGETIKLVISATVPLLSLDNFVVEVGEGANVVFDSAYPKNRYQITKRSSAVYEVKKAEVDYIEVVDDFDSITMLDTNGTAETIEVKDGETVINKYQQLMVTAGQKSSFTFDYEGVALPRMSDNLYTVHQFLFSAEGGAYVDGTFIKPTNVSPEINVLGIKIVKGDDGKYYAVLAETQATAIDLTSIRKTELNSNGDWNVVTIVTGKYRDSYTIGDANVGHKSCVYVNGTYLGEKSQSMNNHIAISKLTVTAPAGSDATLLFDDFIGRFYLAEMGEDNLGRYSTPDTYGVDDFYAQKYGTDLVKLQDVKYNKYNTPLDYPAMLVDGQAKYPSGVAEVNGIGYFDMADALAALKDEESTIKLFKGTKIEGIDLEKFYVEDYSGAVTFDTNYKTTSVEIDGGIRYTVTKLFSAYIGEKPYDTVADALEDLENGGTVQIYLDATITSAKADNFIVEVYEGANVIFDPVFLRNHKITKRSDTVYEVVKLLYTELVDNLDSVVDTSDAWTATTVEAGNNKYQKLTTTDVTQKTNLKFLNGETNIPKIWDSDGRSFSVVQFLLGSENGKYINNLYIHPMSPDSKPSDVRGIMIYQDGTNYKVAYSEKGAIPTDSAKESAATLNSNSDWNVVTLVIDTHWFSNGTTGVRVSYYVNGKYIGAGSQSSMTDATSLTWLQLDATNGANDATANIIIDGFNVRYYGNNANVGKAVIGGADVRNIEELKYSKYSTTEDYPAFKDAEGNVAYQSGVVAEVNGLGYFDAGVAFGALEEGGTIKFLANAVVPATNLKNFTVLYAEGVEVDTTALDESHIKNDVAGGWSFSPVPRYNVVYKYGEEVIGSEESKPTLTKPEPSGLNWPILGDASKATWMVIINDNAPVEFTGAITFNEGDNVIVYPSEDSIVTLTWNGIEGRADKYFKGSELINVECPELTVEIVEKLGNKWYDLGLSWAALPETITADLEVQKDVVPVANLSFKINYTLSTRFVANFYIPQEIEGVTIDAIYSNKNLTGTQIPNSENRAPMPTQLYNLGTEENENLYYKVNEYMYLAPTHLARIQAVQVEYTVVYEGKTYTLVDTSKVSFIATGEKQDDVVYYAETVLGTGKHDSGTKLVAEFLNLFKCANSSKEGVEEAVDALLATHADCDCKPADLADAVPEASDDTLTFADVDLDIKIDFITDTEAGYFRVYINKAWVEANTNVKVSFLPTGVTGKLGIVNNKYVDSETPWHEFDQFSDSGDYRLYGLNNEDDFGLYNYACVITFKIEADGMAAIEFTYSLGQYLYDLTQNVADAQAPSKLELAYAYKNFVEAAYLYKSGK